MSSSVSNLQGDAKYQEPIKEFSVPHLEQVVSDLHMWSNMRMEHGHEVIG